MGLYKTERTADLEFSFPDDLLWEELDKQGVKLPVQMKFVDIVIERESDILLVEVKDPSNRRAPTEHRQRYFKELTDNSILTQELTPKARGSYIYLHLMERDTKPFIYVVLIGLDAYDAIEQKALLTGFKDRLLADIRCEAATPWRRHHIADCVVLSVDVWNKLFVDWPVARVAAAGTSTESIA
ncbi:hypothetical protein [Rhizobium ruizarguesonis]|uniref:hypothetical protein n=1 Tax=Rhizobium ruizarguesonis TaxID=2081791 RepID=UPI0010402D31|nr:hypothetical protein [Rhizobium ruizarguesonis]MBY5806101.1 hypothetical protein [Rhizobium leguminosarum]TCB12110.1 hypothetical protein E0J18_24705 [Rhizobium leguminosarum bv. viciae]MBY5846861.1 hypothetical protein [Rhizobium leguminosarum]NEH87934.1 hypothetical protein [Rhizobium ruizarguesonis]NEJ58073.1 hypothetical protein [Rhizobium ruizarguesonis]